MRICTDCQVDAKRNIVTRNLEFTNISEEKNKQVRYSHILLNTYFSCFGELNFCLGYRLALTNQLDIHAA